ncbi:hypothetical protein Tco_0871365 [Tanacetum coccineum]
MKNEELEVNDRGDGPEMVVQMVATLCALQRQILEYTLSCRVANPNEADIASSEDSRWIMNIATTIAALAKKYVDLKVVENKCDDCLIFATLKIPKLLTLLIHMLTQHEKWIESLSEHDTQLSRIGWIPKGRPATTVLHEVHVCTEVNNYVDEGLSESELVKKIADMQQDFQSRITALEQYVKHPMKITDMELEFQRHITEIEQYLKIPTSGYVEMTSCGSNNHLKHGVNEDMDVDCDLKTSCGSDVNATNVYNQSMDVDHFTKQQDVARKNLFDEEEQHVASNNFSNDEALEQQHVAGTNLIYEEEQQVASKNLEVPLEGEELVAMHSLMQMIDFDIHKEEMHDALPTQPMMNATKAQGSDDGEIITSRITDSQSQYEIHNKLETLLMNNNDYVQGSNDDKPESTIQKHKVRAKQNKVKKRCLPLTALDGKEIPAWTKGLFRLKNAPRTRVSVPKDIMHLLRENKEQLFYFPWANDGTFVDIKF